MKLSLTRVLALFFTLAMMACGSALSDVQAADRIAIPVTSLACSIAESQPEAAWVYFVCTAVQTAEQGVEALPSPSASTATDAGPIPAPTVVSARVIVPVPLAQADAFSRAHPPVLRADGGGGATSSMSSPTPSADDAGPDTARAAAAAAAAVDAAQGVVRAATGDGGAP